MADLSHLRDEIAARLAAELAAGQAQDCRFGGDHERVSNIVDSANGVGTYTTVERIHPRMARVVA